MIEDKPIDYKTEYNKTINKLVSLRQKHDGLKEDYDYIKSLNNKHFDEKIKLEKENKELKQSNKDAWNLIQFIYNEIKEDGYIDWGRIQDLVEF